MGVLYFDIAPEPVMRDRLLTASVHRALAVYAAEETGANVSSDSVPSAFEEMSIESLYFQVFYE